MKKRSIMPLVLVAALAITGCGGAQSAAPAATGGTAESVELDAVEGLQAESYTSGDTKGAYYVMLPEGYEADGQNYPTVYLMPYDGYSCETYLADGLLDAYTEITQSEEALDMILVLPTYAEGQDYDAMMADLVADVDSKYNTIAEKDYRGILGVNIGSYMAFENVLNQESELFFAAGSHMGDFSSEDNPYLAKGDLVDVVNALDQKGASKGYDYLSEHYFYIDVPNEDPVSIDYNVDIGSGLQKRTNPYYQWGYSMYATPDGTMVSYAVLDGTADSAFYLGNLHRSLSDFSTRFAENLYKSELSLDARAVSDGDDSISGKVAISFSNLTEKYGASLPDAQLTVQMWDGTQTTLLDETQMEIPVSERAEETFSFDKSKMGELEEGYITCDMSILGKTMSLEPVSFVCTSSFSADDETSYLDLRGNWYFNAYKNYTDEATIDLDQIGTITPDVYESWGEVQPGFGWWTADFDESLKGQDNFPGYAWYVRTFELDEAFPKDGLKLAVGYFDEANEVFVNGKLIGSTGMNYDSGIGVYDGSNPWDVNCVYDIDASALNYGGENTIAVRMCNSDGGGGWYEGPIGIYPAAAYEAVENGAGGHITEATYISPALKDAEMSYRIYVPECYDEADASTEYPVMYLLHGINSTSKSFVIDGIDKLLDQAIADGEIEPMIVVMPDDPTKQSFWKGAYARMVAEDLVAEVESKYHVAKDREHRYVAGCSMGGGGAVHIGLDYPDTFSGVISFYGALSYVDAIPTARKMPLEKLQSLKFWMACGNQDNYDFYMDQEYMSRLLTQNGVEHYHYVDNGTHSSTFYLPLFIKAIKYVQE